VVKRTGAPARTANTRAQLPKHMGSVFRFTGAGWKRLSRQGEPSIHTTFDRFAVRALLGGGSRSRGLDEFSSGSSSRRTTLSNDL
jgi:hypothetical protein